MRHGLAAFLSLRMNGGPDRDNDGERQVMYMTDDTAGMSTGT
jgi:hypothetical protein